MVLLSFFGDASARSLGLPPVAARLPHLVSPSFCFLFFPGRVLIASLKELGLGGVKLTFACTVVISPKKVRQARDIKGFFIPIMDLVFSIG